LYISITLISHEWATESKALQWSIQAIDTSVPFFNASVHSTASTLILCWLVNLMYRLSFPGPLDCTVRVRRLTRAAYTCGKRYRSAVTIF
jgi:hypothetical protein